MFLCLHQSQKVCSYAYCFGVLKFWNCSDGTAYYCLFCWGVFFLFLFFFFSFFFIFANILHYFMHSKWYNEKQFIIMYMVFNFEVIKEIWIHSIVNVYLPIHFIDCGSHIGFWDKHVFTIFTKYTIWDTWNMYQGTGFKTITNFRQKYKLLHPRKNI